MDVGQSTANALWQQAVDGTFKMEPDAAKKCAGVFVRFVDTTIEAQLKKAQRLNQLTGFGDFGSAQALQSGFSTKATSMIEALTSMKAASLKMSAAYLRAAQLIGDSESQNAHAIKEAINGSGK